jgi:predicted small secreted protein
MKRYIALILLLLSISVMLAGCGETFQGIGKDAGRMGKGVNTFLFRQE